MGRLGSIPFAPRTVFELFRLVPTSDLVSVGSLDKLLLSGG